MSPPSRVPLLVIGLCCLFAGVAGVAAQDTGAQPAQAAPDADTNVSMVAQLDSDGNAHWRLSTTFNLTTQNETEAFRTVAADFENGDLPALGLEGFETGLDGVEDRVDREMAIVDVERSSAPQEEIEAGNGRLTVEFTWENFARRDGDTLVIDRRVLVTESGDLWLKGLGETQSLTIIAPEGYGVRDATVVAQNGELGWEGPVDFDGTTLQATFVGPGSEPPTDTGNEPDPPESSDSMLWVLVAVGAAGLVLALLVSQFDRIKSSLPGGVGATPPGGGGSAPGESGAQPGEPTQESQPAVDGSDPPAGAETEPEDDGGIDEELLSDEERVERLLSSNGGRMKQADIVKETDWSNAKVSQLLSAMEEEGRIDKLRIGRENLISFPDEDITELEE
jgi:hypothetical protein